MKTASDPRHRKRAQAVQDLFAYEFNPDQQIGTLARQVSQHLSEVDQLIALAAPARPFNQINKLDLAILRLAAYELTITKDAPYKVVVDEAVELAKEFGSDNSPQFINGALGQLIQIKDLEA